MQYDNSDGFFHWLAGLIDGEGSFTVGKKKGGPWFHPRFALKLRDDDEPIVRYIHYRTGLGRIFRSNAPDYYRSNPQIVWQIADVEGCSKLVQLLDEYPLRAKKLAAYKLWRQIVLDKHENPIQPGPKRGDFRTNQDRELHGALKAQMTELYKYTKAENL